MPITYSSIVHFIIPFVLISMCVISKLRREGVEKDYDCFGDYDFDSLGIGTTDTCTYKEVNEVEHHDDRDCLMQINCRGLKGKQGDLNQLINHNLGDLNISVIMLIETWLKDNEEQFINIDRYNFVGLPRPNRKGGGVGLLIRKDIEYRIVATKSVKEIEYIVVEKKGKRKELIGATYRPPNTDIEKFLKLYDDLIGKFKHQDLTIGIDHNLDLIKGSQHAATQRFLEMNYDHDMLPTITKPTRVTKSSATLIDNIFCKGTYLNFHESHVIISDISDHFPCIIRREANETDTDKVILKRKINDKVITQIKNDLSKIDLTVGSGTVDVEFERLQGNITDALNRHAPEKRVVIRRNNKRSPWISRGLERSMKRCNEKYCTYLKDRKNDMKYLEYKSYRTALNKIKRRARKDYYSRICTELKRDSKRLWKMINNISKRCSDKTSVIDVIKSENFTITGGKQISNSFAQYFSEIGRNYYNKIPKPKKDCNWYLKQIPWNEKSLFMRPITLVEVDKLIGQLPNKHSSGYDDINNIMLKELRLLITEPLTELFNRSLREGIFPEAMKQADTVPLYKSKERNLRTNYRPVSLLVTLSKLLEKTVHNRVYQFLENTNQMYASQYGFRKKHSCETAIAELVAEITKNIEEKKYTLGIFLDLSKAFDTLSHDLLLEKLERYGVRGVVKEWFRSYLVGRKLRVKCNTTSGLYYSEYYDVEYGTPQGSCLGPLLFLIFNNDIHRHLTLLKCILFADDTTLFKGHSNLRYLKWCVESELLDIEDWFRANGLTLNLSKTECVLFGATKLLNKESIEQIRLGDLVVDVVDKVKFLGMWLDRELKFTHHISQLVLKLKRNLNMLKISNNFLNAHCKKMIYSAHLQSHIQYGLVVWGPMCGKESKGKIRKCQEAAAGLIAKGKSLVELDLLPIDCLIKQELCKLGRRYVNGDLPLPIMNTMTTNSMNKSLEKKHKYCTRNKNIPNNPKACTNTYQMSYLVTSLSEYQKLPLRIKEIRPDLSFKKILKKHLLHEYK